MTKKVRIEDADISAHGVIVETWQVGQGDNSDVMNYSQELHGPTALVELYIHSGQYLIVKEKPPGE